MDISYFLSCIFLSLLIFFEDVSSVSVNVDRLPSTSDIQVGNNQVQLRCTYTYDSIDQTILIEWQKESPRGSGTFQSIALFYKPNGVDASFTSTVEGLSFQNRSSLTNPTSQSLTAILTVNEILCDDDGNYRCKYTYVDTSVGVIDISKDVSFSTKAPGDSPYDKPMMSKAAGTIEEGDSVVFTCSANVGKPLGTIRWWKYRSTVNSASEIVPPTPSAPTPVPGVCEYNVTSTMTTQLTKDDDNARIRCSVDQELIPGSTPENKAFMETDPINVYYKVGVPTVTKVPNSNEYQVGENLLDLTCSAEGNPNPATDADNINKFTWYYKSSDNDNETMATDVNNAQLINGDRTLRISNLVEDQAGIYICEAQNGFNNKVFQERSQIQVTIVKTTTTTTTTPATTPSSAVNTPTPAGQGGGGGGGGDDSGLGGGVIAAIVIVVIIVIVLVVVAIVCVVMKRRNKDDSIEEPSEKPRNNHLTTVNQTNMLNEKNSPFYQPPINQYEKNYNKDLQYADLTFDNKPRSRNPMVLNEMDTSNLDNQGTYSQVMMPSV